MTTTAPDEGPTAAPEATESAGVADPSAAVREHVADAIPAATVALVAGAALALVDQHPALVLVVVGVLQVIVILAVLFGLRPSGARTATAGAVIAAAAADVVILHWQHSGLSPLLGVLGLTLPVLFAFQLGRGVKRREVTASLGTGVLLVGIVVAAAGWPALAGDGPEHGWLMGATALSAGTACAAALLVDLVLPAPRFDPASGRGLPGLLVGVVVGAVAAMAWLHNAPEPAQLGSARELFLGGATGLLTVLLSVGLTFVTRDAIADKLHGPRIALVLVAGAIPIALIGPAAYVLTASIG